MKNMIKPVILTLLITGIVLGVLKYADKTEDITHTRNMHCHAILDRVVVRGEGEMTEFCKEMFKTKEFQQEQLTKFYIDTYPEVKEYLK